MITDQITYKGYRYPPEIISQAVWLYYRFCLSYRDVEDLLAERGIIVSYETVRRWCGKFGPSYARAVKRVQGVLGDTWFLDEVFVTIQGRRQYLWRAVDQDGDTLDILVQNRRDRKAAERFFRKLLKGQCTVPRWLVTDKLKSYSAAPGVPPWHRSCTSRSGMPTIEPRSPTSQHGRGNTKCAVSSRRVRLSDSWRYMQWSAISFGSVDI